MALWSSWTPGQKYHMGGFFDQKFPIKKVRISCSAQTPLWTKSKSDEACVKLCFEKFGIECFPKIHLIQRFEIKNLME
jgi:hypothetical protein